MCFRSTPLNVLRQYGPMDRSTVKKNIFHFCIEFLFLIVGSMIVGATIGLVQHFIAFRVFSRDGLWLATFEGGIVGAAAGLPTGIVVYYGILKRKLDYRSAAYISSASLVGGCILAAMFLAASALLTPFLTVGIAAWVQKAGLHS